MTLPPRGSRTEPLPDQSVGACPICGAGPNETCDFDCGAGERSGRWLYRATCNGDPTPYGEGWTDDNTIAQDEAALLSESLGKSGVRIEQRWVNGAASDEKGQTS